ncbi:MAG: cytochrome c oxidase subunit II [Myxococcota bacterium]
MQAYLDTVSTYASEVDNLVLLIAILTGFWFFLCEAIFFFFIFRYRRKPGVRADYITGEEKELKRWITIPHMLVLVCDVFIIIGAVRVWYVVKQDLPPAERTVRITGQQWAWTFVEPGPDGVLDTADDIRTLDELHIQVDTLYHYELGSRDVIHSFSVPVFRLKQDALPGRIITGWFKAQKTGAYDIQCAEICGIGHGLMAARIVIETPAEHAAWMSGQPPIQLAAAARPRGVEE